MQLQKVVYSLYIFPSAVAVCIVVTSMTENSDKSKKERARRLVRTQTRRQRAKMQPLPREVCGKSMSTGRAAVPSKAKEAYGRSEK